MYGWNCNVFVKKSPDVQIVTDASPSGYGETCLVKAGLRILDSIYSQYAPKCRRTDDYFDGSSHIWTTGEKQSPTDCDRHLLAINLDAARGGTSHPFSWVKYCSLG